MKSLFRFFRRHDFEYEEKCKEYNKLIYSEYELVKGETDEK